MKVRVFATWIAWILFLACAVGYWTSRDDILMAFEFVLLSLVMLLVALLVTWGLMRYRKELRDHMRYLAAEEAERARHISERPLMTHKGREVAYFSPWDPCGPTVDYVH